MRRCICTRGTDARTFCVFLLFITGAMGDVMMLIVFCTMVMAIIGNQIYMGVLRQKCMWSVHGPSVCLPYVSETGVVRVKTLLGRIWSRIAHTKGVLTMQGSNIKREFRYPESMVECLSVRDKCCLQRLGGQWSALYSGPKWRRATAVLQSNFWLYVPKHFYVGNRHHW